MAGPVSAAQPAFNKALRDFRTRLKDPALYSEILKTTSIDEVYDLTDELQLTQSAHLADLGRIQPYLTRLKAYTSAIDTFVQAKPEILALIWGPIKLVLQWAGGVIESLAALARTIEEIGVLLPEFDQAARLFGGPIVNEVLALLFQDILDFHLIAVKFFSMKRWATFFEALWPRKKEEIEKVMGRMERHTAHPRNKVRMSDIQEAHDARERELESLARLEEADRRRKFSATETAVSPKYYWDRLSYLRTRVCEGTQGWLVRDPEVEKWLKGSRGCAKILWLRGIPGAGKTYAAACVVQASTTLDGNTLFAFLSYEDQIGTALSVIHSLIFQVARKNANLQDLVCYIDRDTLESDIPTAVDLLVSLINGCGPVRIVIDGLDEIDEFERALLLRQVLKVTRECDNARVLISSRPEDNVESLLRNKSTSLHAETRNASSIKIFLKSRFHEWLDARTFSTPESEEITALMDDTANKTQGMFLYAHLVLRCLDYYHSIDDIRHHLKVPPKDLKAAYGRIFERINESLPNEAIREKARKTLGWIGCTPRPLTIRELEQALIVEVGNIGQTPTGMSTLNLVHLCGPVVEIVDDEIHFVHFTAKEYFFSAEIERSLSPSDALMSLAMCCITYLCQDHHDEDLDGDLFEENVKNGVYRLHHFAADMWATLIESYFAEAPAESDSPEIAKLTAILDIFTEIRANESYLPPEERPIRKTLTLEILQEGCESDAYELVRNELEFRRESHTRLFELGKRKWQTSDPLTIRRTTTSLHKAFQRLHCPPSGHVTPCYCSTLTHHYGTGLFKCSFVGCDFQRLGFETSSEVRKHSRTHDRPWTCEVAGCEYSEIGFPSRQVRDRHLDKAHRVDAHPEPVLSTAADQDEEVIILKTLVRGNKLVGSSTARELFSNAPGYKQWEVLLEAASFGTYDQMDFLWPMKRPDIQMTVINHKESDLEILGGLLARSLAHVNYQALRWIEAKARVVEIPAIRVRANHVWETLMGSDTPEMLYQKYAETWFLQASRAYRKYAKPRLSRSKSGGPFFLVSETIHGPAIIRKTRGEALKETILLSLWNTLAADIKDPKKQKNTLSKTLSFVAMSTYSLRLAKWLLDHGARVEDEYGGRAVSSLVWAAKKDSSEAAEFMRYLLYHGDYKHTIGKAEALSTMTGPRNIHKWLGASWDELIEQAKEARRGKDNSSSSGG